MEMARNETQTDDSKLFPGTWPDRAAKMVRGDLKSARGRWLSEAMTEDERRQRDASGFLRFETDEGRADFHALRHTFITNLVRSGVHPKLAKELARHSTITLTMDHYAHVGLAEMNGALAFLPSIECASAEPPPCRASESGRNVVAPMVAPKTSDSSDTQELSDGSGETEEKLTDHAILMPAKDLRTAMSARDKVPPVGFEPTTCGLRIRCSAN